jgi:hypothetical protein
MSHDYPSTVAEILNLNKKFKPAVLRAVKAFARSKPWRGTIAERQDKFRQANRRLARAFNVVEPILLFETDERQDSGASCYIPGTRTIVLRGKLSITTFFHEVFHHVYGPDERVACDSINLFRRCFPRSFARCRHDGHMLRSG